MTCFDLFSLDAMEIALDKISVLCNPLAWLWGWINNELHFQANHTLPSGNHSLSRRGVLVKLILRMEVFNMRNMISRSNAPKPPLNLSGGMVPPLKVRGG